jgi:Tat protein translocase TatB subunit
MNFGFSEIVMVFVVALICFGPEKMPEIVRTLAKLWREYQRLSNEVKADLRNTMSQMDLPKVEAPNLRDLVEKIEARPRPADNPARAEFSAPPGTEPAAPAATVPPLSPAAMAMPAPTGNAAPAEPATTAADEKRTSAVEPAAEPAATAATTASPETPPENDKPAVDAVEGK